MEPSSYPSAPLPAGPSRNRTLITIALVTGLISSLVSAYILWGGKLTSRLPSMSLPQTLLLAPSTSELFPAALLDTASLELSPLTVPGQGEATIIGHVRSEDRDYYLLVQEEGSSNVFAVDRRNPEQGLTQLTLTDTLKLDLARDPQTGLLAYTTYEPGSEVGVVTVLYQGTTTERMIAPGRAPAALKGGTHLMYEYDGQLYALDLGRETAMPALQIPRGGSYAIDGEGLRAVLYDPSTRSLQFFALSQFGSASAERTILAPLPGDRLRLALSRGALASVISSEEGLFVQGTNRKRPDQIRRIPNAEGLGAAAVSIYEN